MKDVTEDLIILLEDLYEKEQQIEEITMILQGEDFPTGPGLLDKTISNLELLIIQHLGGTKGNLNFLRELYKFNPFSNLKNGKISREKFLKIIKRGIRLDLRL
ncbi:hypothetical protein [Virgibacillus doumboii]|uniref:hypothetical protein n=1 Tax=Virgibacillus doumboii TaxID=2697503 RepID=UPI0013E0264E|nr:hypothetical protein [Virgibacillus doumboii]